MNPRKERTAHDDQRERFGRRGNMANVARWKIYERNASLAASYRSAGKLEEAEKHHARAEAARTGTLSLSEILTGRPATKPVSIAERRRQRQEEQCVLEIPTPLLRSTTT